MGKTIAEKILSEKSNTDSYAGDIVVANIDVCMTHSGNRPLAQEILEEMGVATVFDPQKVIMINDHEPHTPTPAISAYQAAVRDFAKKHGTLYHELGEGIEHVILPEQGEVGPGDLVVGSDSHCATYGAINCFSVGVGSSELASVMACGKLWLRVPETIRFDLNGELPDGVYAKDIMLYLLGKMRADGALYKAVEFAGPVVHAMNMDARFTLCNACVEMGAKATFIEIDDVAEEWLRIHHPTPYKPVFSDSDANVTVIPVDVSHLEPQVSKPHTVDNVSPVADLGDIPVNIAVVGTCANGRLDDLKVAAEIVRGKHVMEGVRFYVTPASKEVYMNALKLGYIETLVESGAIIGPVGCCGCGNYFGCPDNGENVISAGPRNFKGKKGNKDGLIYLGSPATVAASALAGKIVDCRDWL